MKEDGAATLVVVSLGSNIDKERNLPCAVALLRKRMTVLAVSSVYETVPVGLLEQANFWNMAVLVETGDSAEIIKSTILTSIETALKRVRTDDKNAPRTIDADLTLYGDAVFEINGRHIPEPDLLAFAHVAVPVAELLPEMVHPETGERLSEIAGRLLADANQDGSTIWRVE